MTTPLRFDSAEHFVSFTETSYGPMLKARGRLTGRAAAGRGRSGEEPFVTVRVFETALSRSGDMANVLFVRISSDLDPQEFDGRLLERRPRFQSVPGLVQKIYGRDPDTGDVCGIYFFESAETLAAFRDSELAQTIPAAYEATNVRREVYEILYPLWPDRGPLAEDRTPATAR